ERFEPFRTYGNGTWTYAPNLSSVYSDVERGLWQQSDTSQTDDGIVGAGSISFRIQSPYIFAANPDI
ncbi:MAG: hypothetical protein HRU15_04335, partial [Planctomycetes bacterium]|nr:hypothetical protein [Planctomycetota bacterium]